MALKEAALSTWTCFICVFTFRGAILISHVGEERSAVVPFEGSEFGLAQTSLSVTRRVVCCESCKCWKLASQITAKQFLTYLTKVKVKRFSLEPFTRAKVLGKVLCWGLNHSNHTTPLGKPSFCPKPGKQYLLVHCILVVPFPISVVSLDFTTVTFVLTSPNHKRVCYCVALRQEGSHGKKQSSHTGYWVGAVCPPALVNQPASHHKPRPALDRHLRGTY